MNSSWRPEFIKCGWSYTSLQTGHPRFLHILWKWDNFFKVQFQWQGIVVAGSVASVRAPCSDHSLTSPPHAPDQPLDLDLTQSVPIGHQGILQLKEAAWAANDVVLRPPKESSTNFL